MSCNPIKNVSGLFFCDGSGIDLSCNPIKDVSGIFFCKNSSGIDMSCNSITDVSKISFCPNGGGIDMSCNSITDVSKISFVTCNGGGIDLSCNPIKDVSGIYFCDGSSFTTGNSLDISGAGISFLTHSGIEQMRIDMSGNVGIGTQAPQAKLDVSGRIFVIDVCKNVVVGSDTMKSNTGSDNTILGWNAIKNNIQGSQNVAVGCRALQNNTTGYSNVAVGCDTLKNNISGHFNSCFGNAADASGSFNSCFGYKANASGVSQSTCLGFNAVADISNVVILGDPTDALNNVGIGTSAPQAKLDVSGNVIIRNGYLDMSCNSIRDVSGLFFCNGSGIDLSCNPITDVSGIYFCDGSSFTSGNSLDISASTVHILGTNLIVDASCSAHFFASKTGEFISNSTEGHLILKPKSGNGNITIYDGSGSIVIKPDTTHPLVPGGLVHIDASECLVPYIVGPNIKPNSAATKQYVDSIASGVKPVEHVNFATTSEISSFPPTSVITIDGMYPMPGDRILIKNQTTDERENGIWIVDPLNAGNAWQRAPDFPIGANVHGILVFVENGVQNKNTSWIVIGTTNALGEVIVQTDPIKFTKFAAAGNLIVGAGLYQSGQTLNVGASSSTQIVTPGALPTVMDTWNFDADTTAKIDISGGMINNSVINGGTLSNIGSIQCLGAVVTEDLTAKTIAAEGNIHLQSTNGNILDVSQNIWLQDICSNGVFLTTGGLNGTGKALRLTCGSAGTTPTLGAQIILDSNFLVTPAPDLTQTTANTYTGGGGYPGTPSNIPQFSSSIKGRVWIEAGKEFFQESPGEYVACVQNTSDSPYSHSNAIVLLQKGCDNTTEPRKQSQAGCWPVDVDVQVVRDNVVPKLFYIMMKSDGNTRTFFGNCYIDWMVVS